MISETEKDLPDHSSEEERKDTRPLRPGDIPQTQRGGAGHQPAEAIPPNSDEVRKGGQELLGNAANRGNSNLAIVCKHALNATHQSVLNGVNLLADIAAGTPVGIEAQLTRARPTSTLGPS